MKKKHTLTRKMLQTPCGFGSQRFKTTADLIEIEPGFSQPRARDAIAYGVSVQQAGYNVYAAGPIGLGKREIVHQELLRLAATKPTPTDWCYVNNFRETDFPCALQFPPGMAKQFSLDINQLMLQIQHHAQAQVGQEEILTEVSDYFNRLNEKYKNADIAEYLTLLEENLYIDVVQYFKSQVEIQVWKYQINLISNNENTVGAPIVHENNPTFENLFGKVEYRTQLGTVSSNFTMIKKGSLHQANGGYLVIDAEKLIDKSESWDALKRALQTNKIYIEDEPQLLGGMKLFAIKPKPIPLSVKIILIGSRSLYYTLCEEEAEFTSLFKIFADFDDSLARNTKNHHAFARLMATLVRSNQLKHLNKGAITEMIWLASREVEDRHKMSLNLDLLKSTLIEADYIAEKRGSLLIEKQDILQALSQKSQRVARLPNQIIEDVQRKYTLLDVVGSKIGQINGLTVDSVGDFSYGHPVRITAIARIGRSSEVINIDREVELSGTIHSKGMMILSSYLKGKYLLTQALSISASIVFEQTYESVDGDSASMAELLCLLSSIAEIPIEQSFAITGSVNQLGEVQAVSGLNEKIESFFAVCKSTGLTGNQGVILPASNVPNLVLTDEVIHAVAIKKFHLYAINTVDEAIPLLTGIPSGKRNKYGYFPQETFNYLVEQRLKDFTREVIDEKVGE